MHPMNVIQLRWEGPLTLKQVESESSDDKDYGIYAVYGTHAVFGPDSLLYVGQASSATFSGRTSAHREWIEFEATPPVFYLARLAGVNRKLSDAEWGVEIDNAEKIIIYDCSPPYNSKGLKSYTINPGVPVQNNSEPIDDMPSKLDIKQIPNVLVINHGARNRIPLYCSSYLSIVDRLPPIYKRSEH